MVNAKNEAVYCKFHYKTNQGIKCFDRHQADEMAKQDPDYAIRWVANGTLESITSHPQRPLQQHCGGELSHMDNVHPGHDLPGGRNLGI
jgi:hypothetical protein